MQMVVIIRAGSVIGVALHKTSCLLIFKIAWTARWTSPMSEAPVATKKGLFLDAMRSNASIQSISPEPAL
jgi:hypothetical protein